MAGIARHGFFRISASQINLVREARLMAKFDQSSHLPDIFKRHGLSILPVTRGEYLIGPFRAYETVSYPVATPQRVQVPNLQSLDHTNLYSESAALLFAYNSGIIMDIMGTDQVSFTVNGRMSSGQFDFDIDTKHPAGPRCQINVQNTQVEIDAGYESPDSFCICEAKNVAASEILVRQLYYPYRLWKARITKSVIPVFLVFSNDVFHAFIYEFPEESNYNSIRLKQYKTYSVADEAIYFSEVVQLWNAITPLAETIDVPFPQADSFERVLDLLSVLHEGELSKEETTLRYVFDERQTDYYIAACRYLGLVEKYRSDEGDVKYRLTRDARALMGMGHKPKHLELIKRILRMPVFHAVFGLVARQEPQAPNRDDVIRIMKECGLAGRYREDTIERRASTVVSWIDWILRCSAAH